MLVGEHLYLDMPGVFQMLFEIDIGGAAELERLGTGLRDRVEERGVGMDDAHAAVAPVYGGLDDHRIAELFGEPLCLLRIVGERRVGAGNARDAGGFHGAAQACLVVQQAQCFRLCADEGESGGADAGGEVGAAGEESVSRMDGFGITDDGRRQDCRGIQVAQAGRGGADADSLVGEREETGAAVRLGVRDDGLDAEVAARQQDAQGDFTAVGDQDLSEHALPIR